MALHNVLPFPTQAPVAGRRQRARPADVIPLRPRLRRHRSSRATLLYAFASIVLWGAAVVLGLFTFRLNRVWIGDLISAWPGWPIWVTP
jgi:hypothetical protein